MLIRHQGQGLGQSPRLGLEARAVRSARARRDARSLVRRGRARSTRSPRCPLVRRRGWRPTAAPVRPSRSRPSPCPCGWPSWPLGGCTAARARSVRGRARAPTLGESRGRRVDRLRARRVALDLRAADPLDLEAVAVRARHPLHAEPARQLALQRARRDCADCAELRAHALVSTARHLPSASVRDIRAIWLWMWSCGSPSRLVPCSHEVTTSPAGSNPHDSSPLTRAVPEPVRVIAQSCRCCIAARLARCSIPGTAALARPVRGGPLVVSAGGRGARSPGSKRVAPRWTWRTRS